MKLIAKIFQIFMKSLPGAKMVNNCEIAIIGIEKNKVIQCHPDCMDIDGYCSIKNTIKCKHAKGKCFTATVVTINEKNLGYNGYLTCHVSSYGVTLIDSDGFSYQGEIMCEKLNPLRYATHDTKIPLLSQINYSVIFPQLPAKVEISRILVQADEHGDEYADFEIGNMNSDNDGGDI